MMSMNFPLQYQGVKPINPPNLKILNHAPTATDNKDVSIGDMWINTDPALGVNKKIYQLIDLRGGTANWAQTYPYVGPVTYAAVTIDPGDITVTTGDINLPGNGDVNLSNGDVTLGIGNVVLTAGTIDLLAFPAMGMLRTNVFQQLDTIPDGTDGQILISETGFTPSWGNITSTTGSVAISYTAGGDINLEAAGGTSALFFTEDDMVSVSPHISGDVRIFGDGINIKTTGDAPAHEIHINLQPNVFATTFSTTTPDYLEISGNTIASDGWVADVDINITPKGIGVVKIGGLTAGTLRSDATGNISRLLDGNDGTLLIGKTGDVPIWASMNSLDGSVTITPGANSIDLSVASGILSSGTITWQETYCGMSDLRSAMDVAYGHGQWIITANSSELVCCESAIYNSNPFNPNEWKQRGTVCKLTDYIRGAGYGNGVWIIVGEKGISRALEANLGAWTKVNATDLNKVASDNNTNWVAVGDNKKLIVSIDSGSTWVLNALHPFTDIIYDVHFADGVWVATGSAGKIAYAVNPAGAWTAVTGVFPGGNINRIEYGNGYWVAGDHYGVIGYATDPTVDAGFPGGWIASVSKMYRSIDAIAYGDGVWIVAGANNSSLITRNPTTKWKFGIRAFKNISISYGILGCAYGNGFFVASGSKGGWCLVGTAL